MRTHRKDLDAAVATAERSGLDLPTMRFVHDIFAGLCDAGLGECDHSALILGLEARNQPHRLSDTPDRRPAPVTVAKAY